MLERLGRFCARRHWWVIGAWLILALALGVLSSQHGGQTVDSFSIPGSESQSAIDLLDQQFPAANGQSATVVFNATQGQLTDAANQAAIAASITALGQLPGSPSVQNPFTNPLLANNISKTAPIAYTSVQWAPGADIPSDIVEQMGEAVAPAAGAGFDVQFGGAVVDQFNAPSSALSDHADDIGIALAVVILLISLGGAVAMLMPIGTALFALGVSTSLITLLERYVDIGSIGPILGTMLGIGVGIDYSLFVVSRFRQDLDDGHEPDVAVGRSVGTAGSAVLFAAITVCLAMVALSVIGVPYVRTLGLTAALYVLVTVAAALTLLPAMLGLLGRHINSGRLPWHHKARERSGAEATTTWSARWGREMARRAKFIAPLGLLVLIVLAIPVTRMELGFPSDSSAPADTTQRQAYDLLTEGFGPGANGPLLIVGPLPADADKDPQAVATQLGTFTQKLQALPGVEQVTPGTNPPDYTILLFSVTPTTGPNDPATSELVEQLRTTGVPNALEGTGIDAADVFVGGVTAVEIDLTDRIEERMGWLFLIVLGGSALLLMMVFRSLFVPIKAVIFNLLSIGAAYGIVVAVFEWGWMRDVIGLQETVVIASFVPVMMFAILFGLSMDYEVFLMSRIREDYVEHRDAHEAIVVGIARTARVITSAALIMIAVFLAFVTNPAPTVKMLGLGMAVAVFIDATIVRMVLVPSVMQLGGDKAWWLPRWLDRILPNIQVDAPAKAPKA
jgi:RND superfamily putative drug exporter